MTRHKLRESKPPHGRPRSRWGSIARPLPLLVLLAWWLQRPDAPPRSVTGEPDLSVALSEVLAMRGLMSNAADVAWLDAHESWLRSSLEHPRAVVTAHRPSEPSDVYVARVRLSPEGRLLELSGLYNITETSAVDERNVVVSRGRVAWLIQGSGRTYSIEYADLRREPTPEGPDWTRFSRFQNAITNLHETGNHRGMLRRTFKLEPAAHEVVLGFSESALLVDADSRKVRIPTENAESIEGERFVREQMHHKARPGNLITWAVDRARALPWFGNERMQFIKAIAFALLDRVERVVGSVTGDDGSEELEEEVGDLLDVAPVEYTNPETGWPPAPMEPMLDPPLKGEGKWVSLDQDPFVAKNPGAPSPFVFSFIRTDRKRIYSQVFVTLWDPRQIALHMMSGTVEPKSATGETGAGLVPRDPRIMSRLAGALNGGFQAMHGEFGMMADGVTYLPAKPYAATIAEFGDGSNGFGTWPDDPNAPHAFVSFRQNMTPLILDGEINPYKRHWWGGTPHGWTDDARTVRSAICLTKEHFIAYFYASSTDAHDLAAALERARCIYGIHLDMNAGHTGFEFYRAAPAGELSIPNRPLDPVWEAHGELPGMPGWEFLGRRMIRYMALMNFPRYVHRESRDFFYLTLRSLLPGEALEPVLSPAEPGEGAWQTAGLPQHGWPLALATSMLRPDAERPETKARLVKIDPKMVEVVHQEAGRAHKKDVDKTVVAFWNVPKMSRDTLTLWLTDLGPIVSEHSPIEGARALFSGYAPGDARAQRPASAVGVDADGMLVYAEVSTAPDPTKDHALLIKIMSMLGCREFLLLLEPLGAAVGGQWDLSGHPYAKQQKGIVLVRREGPGGRRIFESTPVVKPSVWALLQAKRARYVHEP